MVFSVWTQRERRLEHGCLYDGEVMIDHGMGSSHEEKSTRARTGTASDDAFPSLLLRQTGLKVVRSPDLKAEDFVKILALQPYLISEFCAKISGVDQWCLFYDFVDL